MRKKPLLWVRPLIKKEKCSPGYDIGMMMMEDNEEKKKKERKNTFARQPLAHLEGFIQNFSLFEFFNLHFGWSSKAVLLEEGPWRMCRIRKDGEESIFQAQMPSFQWGIPFSFHVLQPPKTEWRVPSSENPEHFTSTQRIWSSSRLFQISMIIFYFSACPPLSYNLIISRCNTILNDIIMSLSSASHGARHRRGGQWKFAPIQRLYFDCLIKTAPGFGCQLCAGHCDRHVEDFI